MVRLGWVRLLLMFYSSLKSKRHKNKRHINEPYKNEIHNLLNAGICSKRGKVCRLEAVGGDGRGFVGLGGFWCGMVG